MENNLELEKVQAKEAKKENLDNIRFIDSNSGTVVLPSLVTPQEESDLDLKPDFYVNGYETLRDAVRHIKHYEIADDYNEVLQDLDYQSEFWLKFIANFKSVHWIHLLRQVQIFPEYLSSDDLKKSIKKLLINGLIQRWNYNPKTYEKRVYVYTLTGHGFRFLKRFYPDYYFDPQNFLNLNISFHIRFWETVDVFQSLLSLPAYNDSSTLFHGNRLLVPSPLQVNIDLSKHKPKNLVIYPTLQEDGENYYKKIVTKWSQFIEQEGNHPAINSLSSGVVILAFYTPTIKRALELNEKLQLTKFSFASVFIVGEMMVKEGISKSFYLPDRKEGGLRHYEFKNIMQEND